MTTGYLLFWLAILLGILLLGALVIKLLKPAWRRPVLFRAVAVLLSLLLSVATVELFCLLLPTRHQMDNPWYLATGGARSGSDDLPFERPPHIIWKGISRGDLAMINNDSDPYARMITFQTDMHGFHNSRDLYQADLVTIGDSFTEAGNVLEEESFTTLAGKVLGITSRNLGRAGYTAATELIVLKKYGLPCRPKFVVWQLAESNDLAESLAYKKWVSRGKPRYFDSATKTSRLEAWQKRSPTFRLFRAVAYPSPGPWRLSGYFADENGDEIPMRFNWIPAHQPAALSHIAWPEFTRNLLEGARLCRSNNIQLLILLVPMKARVVGPFTDFRGSITNLFSKRPGQSMGPGLKQFCAEHEIPFLDLTEPLREQAQSGKVVYLPYDTHLSPLGHEIVAELITSRLRALEHEQPQASF